MYTSTGWRSLTVAGAQAPSGIDPFVNNIYVANNLLINSSFNLNGNFTGGNNTKITVFGIGTTFTLGETGSCTLHCMDLNPGACFVNEGSTTFRSGNS